MLSYVNNQSNMLVVKEHVLPEIAKAVLKNITHQMCDFKRPRQKLKSDLKVTFRNIKRG